MAISNVETARRPLVSSESSQKLHDAYTVQVTATLNGRRYIDVTAPMPANYQLQLSTNFDNPFNSPLSNVAGGAGAAVENVMTAVTSHTTRTKWLSNAVWQGGNQFRLVLPLVLVAQEDTIKEIVLRMRELLKLVAPSESGGVLKAPGPNMQTASSNGMESSGEWVRVRLGEFFIMEPCVVEDVNCDFDTQMDDTNHCPVSATITISLLSYWTTTREDLDQYFSNKVPA